MSMVLLSYTDLALAAVLVIALAALSVRMKLSLWKQLIIAASRTTVQLLLIGLVLKAVFAKARLPWITLIAFFMLLAAGREVTARRKRRLAGFWGFGVGTGSIFVSSFPVTIFALLAIVGNTPWYAPQYAIPLLGMLLGNTMNGVALGINYLTQAAWEQRNIIEERLILGEDRTQAILDIRRESVRTGLIPIINSMAAAGIISLPGMMTGQILAGSPPVEAVKYQILIMFLIAAGTGFGTLVAVWLTSHRLFDARHRLRLDRLAGFVESS
ncbi:MAG TPA: iron export ABC transporter permease subunit FetB [Deltaproteobacteria bacterium]|nr:iron export ABC transporter permease subunit FetB [Deltaproteobacteria bacterium]